MQKSWGRTGSTVLTGRSCVVPVDSWTQNHPLSQGTLGMQQSSYNDHPKFQVLTGHLRISFPFQAFQPFRAHAIAHHPIQGMRTQPAVQPQLDGLDGPGALWHEGTWLLATEPWGSQVPETPSAFPEGRVWRSCLILLTGALNLTSAKQFQLRDLIQQANRHIQYIIDKKISPLHSLSRSISLYLMNMSVVQPLSSHNRWVFYPAQLSSWLSSNRWGIWHGRPQVT
jgi:hypothetical protein